MKKHFLIFLLLILFQPGILARPIDKIEATNLAYSFLHSYKTDARKAPRKEICNIDIAHISHDDRGNNLLYIFNRSDNGFIIVAGNDEAQQPILGYSDSGYFDINNIPPNMRSFMAAYEQELQSAHYTAQADTLDKYHTLFDKDVAPLVKAHWGQDEPYNALCPSYMNNRAPTGCVATAMAQVMYHHKWPTQGSGKIEINDGARSETIDFANTTYNWDMMTPIYSSLSTEAECDAIATLMYHVGRSVNMMYGDASGAVTADAAKALATYWKYDKSIIHRDRKYYTIAEWERMIMNDIDNNRPIIYHGQSPEGGHAFVLDGYNSDGYVHINWGWNGMSDGYFLLQALSPERQGTGGFTGGYNTGQGAVFGIQPNHGYNSIIEITAQSFTIPNTISYRTGEIISTVVTGIANASWNNIACKMGYMVYDSNNNHIATINSCNVSISASSTLGNRNIMLTLPDTLSNGTYNIHLAHTDAGDNWKHVAMSMNTQPYQTCEVTDGKVVITTSESGSLWATSVICNDEAIYANRHTSFTATVCNTTSHEYQGALYLSIYERSGKFEQRRSDPIAISIPAGSEVSINIPMRIEVSKGTYCLFITNEQKEKLSDSIQVSILDEPESPEFHVTNFTLNSTAQDCLQVSYTVTNNGNDYTGVFRSWLQFSNLQYTSSHNNSEVMTVKKGQSVDVSHTWSYDDGVVGERYICTLWCEDLRKGGMKQLSKDNITFVMTEPTDINATQNATVSIYPNPATRYIMVSGIDDTSVTHIYNTQGNLVVSTPLTYIDVEALPTGIYYVVTHTHNSTVTNKILIK